MSRPPNPELIENIQLVVVDLVRQKGVDALTLRMIARRLSITATTIYYYYKDKDDLINKIKLRGFIDLDNFIAESINQRESYKNQLRTVVTAFVKWCAENENLASLMFEKLSPNTTNSKENDAAFKKTFGRVTEILKKGKEKGEFKVDDLELEATMAFSMIYGMVVLYFNKRFSEKYNKDIELLAKKSTELLYNHLGVKK